MILFQLVVVALFVLVHILAGRLRFLEGIPRSRWLSTAGGISVSYVFMHVFPELAEAQGGTGGNHFGMLINHDVYLLALSGLVVFYGLERVVKASQKFPQEGGEPLERETPGIGVFWLHISSFALYNALIGYLLVHREALDLRGLLLFSAAMALHFLVNDFGLRQDHQDTYSRSGRWILAGAVVLNVLKEELPQERKSRFFPFLAGAVAYSVLLLLL